MKLLLLEDISGLGSLGDEIVVKDGFARNHLLPLNKAIVISAHNKKQVQACQKRLASKRQRSIDECRDLAQKIAELELIFTMKASENGTLFGAVNEKMITDSLAQNGVILSDKQPIKSEHIKQLGQYVINLKLHSEVAADLNIKIVPEQAATSQEQEAPAPSKEAEAEASDQAEG